jgi:hypothetical protein
MLKPLKPTKRFWKSSGTRHFALLLGLMILLTGCGEGRSKVIPTLIEYPPEVQAKAAEEYRTLPEESALKRFVRDYGLLREQIRLMK